MRPHAGGFGERTAAGGTLAGYGRSFCQKPLGAGFLAACTSASVRAVCLIQDRLTPEREHAKTHHNHAGGGGRHHPTTGRV